MRDTTITITAAILLVLYTPIWCYYILLHHYSI